MLLIIVIKLDLLKSGFCTIYRFHNSVYFQMRISCRQNFKPTVMQLLTFTHWKSSCKYFRNSGFVSQKQTAHSHTILINIISSVLKLKLIITEFRRLLSYSLPWLYETLYRNYDKAVISLDYINQLSLNSSMKAIFKLTPVPFDQHESTPSDMSAWDKYIYWISNEYLRHLVWHLSLWSTHWPLKSILKSFQ